MPPNKFRQILLRDSGETCNWPDHTATPIENLPKRTANSWLFAKRHYANYFIHFSVWGERRWVNVQTTPIFNLRPFADICCNTSPSLTCCPRTGRGAPPWRTFQPICWPRRFAASMPVPCRRQHPRASEPSPWTRRHGAHSTSRSGHRYPCA